MKRRSGIWRECNAPMSERTIEQTYRVFLLAMAAAVLAGTTVELLLTEHAESFVQIIPYILSGIGIAALVAVLHRATRLRLRALQVAVVLLALGGVYGIYEHLAHNFAFELEIRPNATAGEVVGKALTGASPLLAPGVLTFAALLAAAATYRHPNLEKMSPADPKPQRMRR